MTKAEREAIVNNIVGRIEAFETAAKLFDAYTNDLNRFRRNGKGDTPVMKAVGEAWNVAATDMRNMAKAERDVLQDLKEGK